MSHVGRNISTLRQVICIACLLYKHTTTHVEIINFADTHPSTSSSIPSVRPSEAKHRGQTYYWLIYWANEHTTGLASSDDFVCFARELTVDRGFPNLHAQTEEPSGVSRPIVNTLISRPRRRWSALDLRLNGFTMAASLPRTEFTSGWIWVLDCINIITLSCIANICFGVDGNYFWVIN